jgi:predicted phage tail protein
MIALPVSYHMTGVTNFVDYRTFVSMSYPMGGVNQLMTAEPLSNLMGGVNQLMTAVPLSYLMGGVNQLLDDCSTTELPDGRSEPAP